MISRSHCAVAIVFVLILFSSQAHSQTPRLSVEELIKEAILKNPEIVAALKRSEVFREKVPQASALQDPMLGFGIINLPTNFSFKDEDMTMKEISISQMLPFPGKRPLMREMAEKEAESVSTEVQGKVNQIVRDVKAAYYDLSHVYRTTEVTQRNKKILEDFAKIAETRYSVGEGIQQDVLKAHVEVAKMVDDLIMLDQKKRSQEAKLSAILNRPSETPLAEPEELTFRKVPLNIEGLQKTAIEASPTLKGMKKMIEAKEKALALAKKEYYPDFNFKFAYGQRDNSPEMKRRDMLSGMVEVNVPIFFKSKQNRKVAEAKADVQSEEARYLAMKNEIRFMITDMVTMVQRIERQVDLYRTGIIPQASLQINSALSSYRVNKADFMTLLDSQMTNYKYELEYHQALTEYEKSLASLEAAVGKEFFERGEK